MDGEKGPKIIGLADSALKIPYSICTPTNSSRRREAREDYKERVIDMM